MTRLRKLLHAGALGAAILVVCMAGSLKAYAAPGDAGAWQPGTDVPDNLAWTNAVTYNGSIYVVSGADNTIYTNTVYMAKLNSDGSVGTWSTTTPAPYVGSSVSVLAYNGYMYYIGGFDGLANETSAFYAPINADGTLGSWTATTDTLNTWSGATVAAHDNYMYLMGGNTGTGPDNSVTYAPINVNGSLGSWTATAPLPDTLTNGASVVHNDTIYYVGGNNGSVRKDTVYYAALHVDGTVGAWQTAAALPQEREGEGLAEYNGYLFSIGGWNATAVTNTVYATPINTNGSVGAWTATASLPDARTVAGTASSNGFVYDIAGLDGTSAPRNTVYYAAVSGYTPPMVPAVAATVNSGASTLVDVLKDATGSPDTATLAIVSGPVHGLASVTSGKITYTSNKGYVGADALTYEVCSSVDRSVCSLATLSLHVVAGAPNTGYAPLSTQWFNSLGMAILAIGFAGTAYCLRTKRNLR